MVSEQGTRKHRPEMALFLWFTSYSVNLCDATALGYGAKPNLGLICLLPLQSYLR